MDGQLPLQLTKKFNVFIDYSPEDIRDCINPYWGEEYHGRSFEEYVPEPEFTWYRIEVDGELAGYFCSHEQNEMAHRVHVCIKREFRKYKKEIVNAWRPVICNHLPEEVIDLLGIIPEYLPMSVLFALENDWHNLGTSVEDGIKYFILGTTVKDFRKEII